LVHQNAVWLEMNVIREMKRRKLSLKKRTRIRPSARIWFFLAEGRRKNQFICLNDNDFFWRENSCSWSGNLLFGRGKILRKQSKSGNPLRKFWRFLNREPSLCVSGKSFSSWSGIPQSIWQS
jgi:hypothetical protein